MTRHRLGLRPVVPPAPPTLGDGETSANDRYVVRNDVPIFPITGEIHYSRLPAEQWESALSSLRANGATHVATYVLWNHHEPRRGELDFAGGLDLRRFLHTAASHDLGAIVRIGPYAHAEARHGGLPDWLVDSGLPLRSNDARYLAEARRWYTALADQLEGIQLFAIQFDNELYDRPEHLAELRAIAEEVGLSAPLHVATAWGGASLPGGVLPVFGGYPESFWIDATEEKDERSAGNFHLTPQRDDDSIGADHRSSAASAPQSYDLPFATCELGAGMAAAYHRRPVVSATDIDALALAKLGSGSVWQGYYMFSDGRNPRPGLQESHATGAPNDFPDLSYDYLAPIAVDGAIRPSWFRLRRQHLFLRRWGSLLATLPAVFPDDATDHPDTTKLRWSVRADDDRGFLFVVNHQPGTLMPAHEDVQFALASDGIDLEFPRVNIPPGVAFVWPFRLALGEFTLNWATAQPITEVLWRGAPLLVLSETAGITAQFQIDADVAVIDTGTKGTMWEVTRQGSETARILIVPEDVGLHLSVEDGTLTVSPGVIWNGTATSFEAGVVDRLTDEGWEVAVAELVPLREVISVRVLCDAGDPPPPRVGPAGRASVPVDWTAAARFELALPDDPSATLVLDWHGDIARMWDGDRLVSDALFRNVPWRIGPHEWSGAQRVTVEILPLHTEAQVYLGSTRPESAGIDCASLETPARARL